MWTNGSWEIQVMREVRRHLASFTPVYIADAATLLGNSGAYYKGVIWLREEFQGSKDTEVEEVLHHEILHGKISRARIHGVRMGGVSMNDAMAQAKLVASDVLARSPRANLLEHYRLNAGQDFAEECLVQLCLTVRFGETVDIPRRLKAACMALVEPMCHRPTFWGGYIGSFPSAFRKLRRWEQGRPIPGKWSAADHA